jgi:hypothetical protein
MGSGLTLPHAWRYIHASVAGAAHHVNSLPCQDYALVSSLRSPNGDPILVLVAADGAGSAARAEAGSKLACSTFVEVVMSYIEGGGTVSALTKPLADSWITQLIERLTMYAYGETLQLRDLASTLIGAVLSSSAAAYLQIGDGAIVIPEDGGYRPVFWPQSGDYINTTYFLTDEAALEEYQLFVAHESPREIAILSDGLQMLALQFSTKRAHAPFFQPLFAQLRESTDERLAALQDRLTEWLDSTQINRRTDDDKTLVLAVQLTESSDEGSHEPLV